MGDLNSRLSGLSEVGYNIKFLIPTIGLVVVLIIFFIVVAVMKKMRRPKTDMLAGLTYLDVTGMKKQGLLTDEEMVKIREAMSRQVERQRSAPAIKAPPQLGGELALMADPEVQQLEKIAEQKARERSSSPAGYSAPEPAPSEMPPARTVPPQPQPTLTSPPPPAIEPNYGDPIPTDFGIPTPASPPPLQSSPALDASAWTRPSAAASDDVTLPPDIVKMVELGLITPDELERIKERIRAKKSALQ